MTTQGFMTTPDSRRVWQLLALRGAVALLFGIIAVAWPGITALALALLFGAYALVDGIGTVVDAVRHPDRPHRLARILGGAAGILFGVITLAWPGVTALALTFLAGVWAVLTGLAEIVAAIRLRKQIRGELLLGLAGLLSVAAGIVVMAVPAIGVVTISVILGGYAIATGLALLALAYRLRKLHTTARF